MKHILPLLTILILLSSCSQTQQSSEFVKIPDEQLAGYVRRALELKESEPIPESKMKELTELEVAYSKPRILDLTGLDKATNLTSLSITNAYDITDIKPLAKLYKLQTLRIYDNSISDLSPLENLTQLKTLTFLRGYVSDLSPLENLTQLTELRIGKNWITDITPLAELTQLQDLSIYNNSLSDISPLSNLKNLTKLHLNNNKINDLSPLAGLTLLSRLSIDNNLISELSPLAGLTQLTAIYFYNNPLIDISALANLKRLEALEFRDPITDISPISKLTKLKVLKFTVPPPEIESLAPLTELRSLEFYDSNISDLSPLTGLTELTELRIYRNQIQDISPLSGMTKLEKLELYRNNIIDISPLAGLTQLTELRLDGNKIRDISALKGLRQLTVLGLERNQISDIQPIENLKKLKVLYLQHNPVEDLSPVQTIYVNNKNLNKPETQYPKYRPSPHPRVFHQHETPSALPEGAIARLGKGGINIMRYSPDGKLLAVGTDVGLYLYEIATSNEVVLPNHKIGQVNAIAFSSDSRTLAIGGFLRPHIQLWNLETRTELKPISLPLSYKINMEIPIHSTYALAFAVKDTTLISVSHFGEVIYWDLNTHKKIIEHHTDSDWDGNVLSLSQDGRMYARGSGVGLHHGGPDGQISLWNTYTGRREAKMRGHRSIWRWSKKPRGIRALTFSPDGKMFASGSEDKTVHIWNTKRRNRRAKLKGHTGWVTALAFSKDSNTIASGDTDGTVHVWNVRKKQELTALQEQINPILALAFAPDGNTLATAGADGEIHFWNPNSGEKITTFKTGFTEWVRSMAFSKDNTTLSTAMFNNTVQKYDVQTGNKVSEFTDSIQKLTHALTLSPDGTLLACHPVNGVIAFNARENWRTDKSYQGHEKIQIWNLSTGKELPPLMNAFGKMTFSPDNKMLVSGSSENINQWVNQNGGVYSSGGSDNIWFWDVESGKKKFNMTPEDYDAHSQLEFTRDGTKLVSSDRSKVTEIWDINTRNVLRTIDVGADAFAISHEGNYIAIKDFSDFSLWKLDTQAMIRNIETGFIKGSYGYSLQGAAGNVLAFSPDGSILLVSSVSAIHSFCSDSVDLVDVETGRKLYSLPGHTEPIESLVFSHDGKILASGSQDGTVLLWDWEEVLKGVMLENKWTKNR